MRVVAYLVLVLFAAALAFAAFGYRSARADPVVRLASIQLNDWPPGATPIRLVLASDIHLESAAMDRARLDRIATQIDALHPDLVVLAGDFIEGSDPHEPATVAPAMIAALRRLHAPLGTVAVLGNHDYWTDAPDVLRLLRQANVTVLRNTAVVRGPIVIGGIDDDSTKHQRVKQTVAAMRGMAGAKIMVAHSPAMARAILKLPAPAGLLLAGHTHCGQIVLPWLGPPVDVVDSHYRCGVVRDPGLITVVTAGLGTSELPLRIGVPPDLWVVTLGPAVPSTPRRAQASDQDRADG